jgi:antitoxin component of MazEF toxin-antitoxin module
MPGFHMRVVIKKPQTPLVADWEAGFIATIPAHFAEYELNHPLAGITQDNLHAEIGFGQAVGAEAV